MQDPEVDRWFEAYENPMRDVVLAVRRVILESDSRMSECIKWKAPTFTYQGNLASFYPRSKAHASLMFHNGALIPGEFPSLEGTGGVSRVMKFASLAEVEAKRPELEALVQAWIASRG